MQHNAHYIDWLRFISQGNPNRYVWIDMTHSFDSVKGKIITLC